MKKRGMSEQLARELGKFVHCAVAFADLRQASGLNCSKSLVFCHFHHKNRP
jgi:hypothetical protein